MAVAITSTSRFSERRPGMVRTRRNVAGLLFVVPALAFVTVFFFVPLVMAGWVSLHDWPLFGAQHYIGVENYRTMFADEQFWRSFWFTTRYAVFVTPLIFLLGFALALLVNRDVRGVGFFRTVYFLPSVVGFGAACLLWFFMANDQFGVINTSLRRLGIIDGSLLWLSKYETAMILILALVVWKTAGGTMLLLLIGMQAIPEDLYHAAMVDGAGRWQRLRSITLPLLKRTFALALVLSITGSYLAFDQFYILTRGGPRNQTTSLVQLITNQAFSAFDVGYATTISIALMVLLILLSSVQLFLLRDSTQY